VIHVLENVKLFKNGYLREPQEHVVVVVVVVSGEEDEEASVDIGHFSL